MVANLSRLMSVRVRLTRVGSKKNPIWRVVVADQRSPRDGRFIETIGQYNPQTDPSTIRIDAERLDHWIARGAQPTNTVKQLMKAQAKSGGPTPQHAPAAAAVADAPEPDAPDEAEAPAEAAPEGEAAPEAEAASEGEAAPEAEAVPEAEAQAEEPVAEASPDEAPADGGDEPSS